MIRFCIVSFLLELSVRLNIAGVTLKFVFQILIEALLPDFRGKLAVPQDCLAVFSKVEIMSELLVIIPITCEKKTFHAPKARLQSSLGKKIRKAFKC